MWMMDGIYAICTLQLQIASWFAIILVALACITLVGNIGYQAYWWLYRRFK